MCITAKLIEARNVMRKTLSLKEDKEGNVSSSHVQIRELDHKEGWAPKSWCFWTWCWRRLLRVPWTARRSNQSILKEINPEDSLEVLMLKLKLQYFDHLLWRADSLEKTLSWKRVRARGEAGDRGWDGWLASPTQWVWVWVNSGRWWRTGKPGVLLSVGVTKKQTQFSD